MGRDIVRSPMAAKKRTPSEKPHTRPVQTRSHLTDLRGLSRLAIAATQGVTSLVEAMHHTVLRAPLPLGKAPGGSAKGPIGAIAGLVYGSVRGVTGLVGAGIDVALAQLAPLLAGTGTLRESEAILGAHEMRVITPTGVSNPLTVRVTDTPEILETGGKHSLAAAQEIVLPIGIHGKVGEADQTDYFKFKGRKGEHLIFDVQANRIGSALDSSLAILDSTGKELARSEDFNGMDSWIDFFVPADADYFLTIRDFQHRGGDTYKYHLTAGAVPYLESIFPFGGERGKTVELTLAGRNLEGAEKMSVSIDANAPPGPQEIRAHTARGFSNPRSFDVSASLDFLEKDKA